MFPAEGRESKLHNMSTRSDPGDKLESNVGRHRRIMTDQILDAAECVLMELGTAGLSISAVAQKAGVSKSTVLYDHKSKTALLEALIDRRINQKYERQALEITAARDSPHPELFGRIRDAEKFDEEAKHAMAVAIRVSVSHNGKLRKKIGDVMLSDLQQIASGERSSSSTMAYLALSGFYFTEILDLYEWTPEDRMELIQGVRKIYDSYHEQD